MTNESTSKKAESTAEVTPVKVKRLWFDCEALSSKTGCIVSVEFYAFLQERMKYKGEMDVEVIHSKTWFNGEDVTKLLKFNTDDFGYGFGDYLYDLCEDKSSLFFKKNGDKTKVFYAPLQCAHTIFLDIFDGLKLVTNVPFTVSFTSYKIESDIVFNEINEGGITIGGQPITTYSTHWHLLWGDATDLMLLGPAEFYRHGQLSDIIQKNNIPF